MSGPIQPRAGLTGLLLAAIVLLVADGAAGAESFHAAGTEFNAQRSVVIPADKLRPIVVVEFLHHGEITPDGRNVAVAAKNHELAPVRVLQVGPGDFCRLAFQTLERQTNYTIFYGGKPPAADKLPKWTKGDGLLLETRRLVDGNLRRFESVRRAFESAEAIGADYVETIQHATNPFLLAPGPFMSRYHGTLHIDKDGSYTFWTASQDCSFLLIDDKVVVDAPGRHWPLGRARPGSGSTVRLDAGPHPFDYYHAATGPSAMMVAAWVVGPVDSRPRPTLIPPEAFRAGSIGRVISGPPATRKVRLMPDFTFVIAGDVPLPDNPQPLVGVAFKDNSPESLAYGASVRWDFGDGQTGSRPNMEHVYLRPGIYRVTLSRRRGIKTVSVTNHICVDRPYRTWASREKVYCLDDYLPMLDTYDPKTLDAAALRQLVAAYLWKADLTVAARQYRKKAVEAGLAAIVEANAAKGDEDLLAVAEMIGPVARVELADSPLALAVWEGAARRIDDRPRRAQCLLRAADIAVGDLLDAGRGRVLLEAAAKDLGSQQGRPASLLHRVWGDCHALAGDAAAARRAYAEAERLLPASGTHNEQTAHRGARSRSAEQFLRAGQWERAFDEIDQWQNEFPSDKAAGYLSLLYARYWVGREKQAQAAALAEQLVAVNPDSPYADRLLLLAAECASKQGKADRAAALLNQLLKDYPGSPLVPEVKERLRTHE